MTLTKFKMATIENIPLHESYFHCADERQQFFNFNISAVQVCSSI